MLEISLVAAVPASQVDQTLEILAGHSASQPVRLHEHHVLFKPKPAAERPVVVGGSQDVQMRPTRDATQSQREALIAHLTRPIGVDQSAEVDDLFDDDDGPEGRDDLGARAAAEMEEERRRLAGKKADWRLEIFDLPQAASKNVTARSVWVAKGLAGDVAEYMAKLEYR